MKRKHILAMVIFCLFGLFSCAPLNAESDGTIDLLGLFSCSPTTRQYTHEEIHEKIYKNIDLNEVYENIYLPTSLYNATITYSSNDENHLLPDGQVARADFDRITATLTSYITIEGVTVTFNDEVTILEKYLTNTISEVYDAKNATEFVIAGNIVDYLSNYFFIQDGSGYLTVIYNTNSSNCYDYKKLKVGDYIRVIGTKGRNNGLVYLSVVDYTEVLTDKFEIKEKTDIDVVPELKDENVGRVYNIHDFIVTKPFGKVFGKTQYEISLKDKNNNNIDIFVYSIVKEEAEEIFKDLKIGNEVTLNSVALSYKDGKYVFYFTSSTSLFVDGLSLSSSTIEVDYNTPLYEALDSLKVYLTDSGVTRTLNKNEYTVSCPSYKQDESGTYEAVITYQEYSLNLSIIVDSYYVAPIKESGAEDLEELATSHGFTTGFASEGNINALVLPIAFPNYDYSNHYSNVISTLNNAFNGSSDSTGWNSVKSYYEKASYGKVTFNATILDVYTVNDNYYTTGTLNKHYGTIYPEKDWIEDALSSYNDQINYSDYDSNNDGKIDTIYCIYLAPYLDSYDSEMAELWWAYTNYYEPGESAATFDNKTLEFYIFASYEFLFDPFEDGEGYISIFTPSYSKLNCETYIHETGHAFGLDDYYDYDDTEGMNSGSGGGLMMDLNVGDHDPYSKCLLNWTDAYIVTSNCKVTLGSFEATGDCLIIPKNWNGSYYSEYYIVDFYTPTGLNERQAGYSGLIDSSGIRIFHVDATSNISKAYDCWTLTKYDNSYTSQVLLEFISARGTKTQSGSETSSSDLFKTGREYSTATWHDGTKCNFTITVDSIGTSEAKITISFD